MQMAADECGLPIPEAPAVRHIIGLSLPSAMPILFPGQPGAVWEQMRDAYSRCYVALDQGPARLHEGALETLERLRAAGLELAVATGKSRRGLDRVLAGLGLETYFESTRCADETRSKPDPLMLQQILAERGKTSELAVMVGDSEYDLAMARNINMASIGVSFGVHSPAQLARYQPLAVVDRLLDLCDLPELIAQARTG
jgi:phosphoglycolate phosphatase